MKSLVIYFSRNGENYTNHGIKNLKIGNTEVIANYIKELTNADLFKVERLVDYPFDYNECIDDAKKEYRLSARPELKKYLSDIINYDVIYIGHPNWWGTAPMPLFTLIEKLNFKSKIIKPFCTHEGSGLGRSQFDIAQSCKKAITKQALAIRGSYVKDARQQVEDWIKQ